MSYNMFRTTYQYDIPTIVRSKTFRTTAIYILFSAEVESGQ